MHIRSHTRPPAGNFIHSWPLRFYLSGPSLHEVWLHLVWCTAFPAASTSHGASTGHRDLLSRHGRPAYHRPILFRPWRSTSLLLLSSHRYCPRNRCTWRPQSHTGCFDLCSHCGLSRSSPLCRRCRCPCPGPASSTFPVCCHRSSRHLGPRPLGGHRPCPWGGLGLAPRSRLLTSLSGSS